MLKLQSCRLITWLGALPGYQNVHHHIFVSLEGP